MSEEQEEYQEEEIVEDVQEPSIEDRAKMRGWRPLEEFKGDPKHHKSAQEYLDFADQNVSINNQNMKALESRVAELTRRLERQDKYMEQNITMARMEAKDRLKEASVNGDEAAVDAAMKQYEAAHTAPPQAPQVDPVVQDFASRNPWYGNDVKLSNIAAAQSQMIAAEHPEYSQAQNLAEVEKLMQAYINPPKRQPTPMEPGRKRAPAKLTGFDSLEQDLKDNFSDMVRMRYYENTKEGKEAYYKSCKKYEEMKR